MHVRLSVFSMISCFVKKKRGDRDFDQIKQSVEMVKDTQHCLLPDGVKMAKDFLTPMQEKGD